MVYYIFFVLGLHARLASICLTLGRSVAVTAAGGERPIALFDLKKELQLTQCHYIWSECVQSDVKAMIIV